MGGIEGVVSVGKWRVDAVKAGADYSSPSQRGWVGSSTAGRPLTLFREFAGISSFLPVGAEPF